MDNGATRSSLSSSFSAWSPDFGPADNNDHIPLPSILQQSTTLNEPLLHPSLHPSNSTSDERNDDNDDDSIGGVRISSSSHAFVTPSSHHHHLSSSSTLVHRAHLLDESVRYRLLAQLVGDGLHTRQFAIGLKNERALWWYEYSHSAVSRGIYSLAMVLFLLLVFIEAPSSNSFVTRNAYVRYLSVYILLLHIYFFLFGSIPWNVDHHCKSDIYSHMLHGLSTFIVFFFLHTGTTRNYCSNWNFIVRRKEEEKKKIFIQLKIVLLFQNCFYFILIALSPLTFVHWTFFF